MTDQKTTKRRVRARMAKTGERYTAARRQLLAKSTDAATPDATSPDAATAPDGTAASDANPAAPDGTAPSDRPAPVSIPFHGNRSASDEALAARTGRTWGAWFALLDAWGAAARPHPEIARWLSTEHGIDGWWAQQVTVGYELATGRRQPGERADGFSVSASKTIAVSVEELFDAFVEPRLRAHWLAGASVRLRTATPHRTARFDWEGGATRIAVTFTPKDAARSTVAVQHERLPDADAAARRRAFWRARLDDLQRLLESGPGMQRNGPADGSGNR